MINNPKNKLVNPILLLEYTTNIIIICTEISTSNLKNTKWIVFLFLILLSKSINNN